MIAQLAGYLAIVISTNLVFLRPRAPAWHSSSPFRPVDGLVLRLADGWRRDAAAYLKSNAELMGRVLSFVSITAIAFIITIITAAGRESLRTVGILLIVTSTLHNVAGYILGYAVAWLFGLVERDRRTLAFEVGIQNGGLASALALNMGKVATVGLAPAILGPLMNVTGSALASWWRNRPPPGKDAATGGSPSTGRDLAKDEVTAS